MVTGTDTSFAAHLGTSPSSRKRCRDDQFEQTTSIYDMRACNVQPEPSNLSRTPTGAWSHQLVDQSRQIHQLSSKFTSSKLKQPSRTNHHHPHNAGLQASRTSPKYKRHRNDKTTTSGSSPSPSQKMQMSPEFFHASLPHVISKPSSSSSTTKQGNAAQRCHICFRGQLNLNFLSTTIENCEVCLKPTCGICIRQCVACDEMVCSGCSQEKGATTFCHSCAALNQKWNKLS